jgi:hypothetical protein
MIQSFPSRLAPRYVQSTAVKKFIHFVCWFGAMQSEIWWTKKVPNFWGSQHWTFFRFFIFLFSVLQTSMQSESTVFIQALHRSSQHPVRRSRYTLHAGLEHWEVEYGKLKISTKFLRISESDTFSDSPYSSSQCSKAFKVNQLFSSKRYTDPHSAWSETDLLCMVDWIH